MHKFLSLMLAAAVVPGLSACGGSSDPAAPAAAFDLAEIDAGNAVPIAGAVAKAVYQSDDISGFVDLTGAVGGAPVVKTRNLYGKLGEIQLSQTREMLKQSQIGTFQAPIGPVATDCAVDGYVELSGNVQSESALGVNDVLTLRYFACDDGFVSIDGTLSMTILAFSGDFLGGPVSFSVAVTLTDLAISQDGSTETANGGLTMALNLPVSGPLSMTITIDELTLSDGLVTNTLLAYALTQTIDPVSGDYSMSVSGTIGGSQFEGQVQFATAVDLSGTGEDFAAAGELVITGDGGATIAVFALGAGMIRLEIDYDGDAVVDQLIDTSWAELLAA